jgi:hypothetical protein
MKMLLHLLSIVFKNVWFMHFLGDSGLTGLPGPKGDRGDGGK